MQQPQNCIYILTKVVQDISCFLYSLQLSSVILGSCFGCPINKVVLAFLLHFSQIVSLKPPGNGIRVSVIPINVGYSCWHIKQEIMVTILELSPCDFIHKSSHSFEGYWRNVFASYSDFKMK